MRGINLLATRPGSLGPHLVVGAHLDTVSRSPGADDNASGVAVALELACRLAEGAPVPVMIAVLDAEESGCLGARALARQLVAEQVLSGMVSLECVGVFSSDPGSQSLPPGLRPLLRSDYSAIEAGGRRGDFVAVIHRRSSRSLAEALCAAASAGGLPAVRVSDPRPDGLAGLASTGLMPPLATLDRSDHAAFWRRGVPAVMVTDTANLRNPAYHTPQDVPANLDYTSMARLCDALEKVVRRT